MLRTEVFYERDQAARHERHSIRPRAIADIKSAILRSSLPDFLLTEYLKFSLWEWIYESLSIFLK